MAIAAKCHRVGRRKIIASTQICRVALVALLFAVLFLSGCSNKSPIDQRGAQPGVAAPHQKAPPSVSNSKELLPAETPSTADKSVPLRNYKLNMSDKDYVAIYFALGGQARDPHEDLRLLIPRYAQENDTFKKQEIADREQANVDRFIKEHQTAEYRYVGYVRSSIIPLGPRGPLEEITKATRRSEVNVLTRVLQPYDLSKKGFPINSDFCSMRYSTHSSITLLPRHAVEPCFLPVADVDVAKKLEAVRVRNVLAGGSGTVRQTFYVYIEGLKNSMLDVTTMATVLQFFAEDEEDYVKNVDAKPIYEATL